jgi:Flp pilus assembly protein TadD
MAQHHRGLPSGLVAAVVFVLFALTLAGATHGGAGQREAVGAVGTPPVPHGLFGPSNARTEGGGTIPSANFFPAARCAKCHRDSHEQWAESLHRNAGREPFYKESSDILQRTRGVEFTRHCESCHAPVALLSGALAGGSREPRALDDEGVTCTVCHSITEARAEGTGSYTLRRPALLEREDGTPVFGDVPDEAILADVPGHRRALMRPVLKTPEFCASCHKSVAPPGLNNYKFIRGFSAYDEWQQSGASRETVSPFYRRERRADCRACHMPAADAASDLAAKEGVIASHRWPGANTATPLFYGQQRQVEETVAFLKDEVLGVDIFAVRREATGELFAALEQAAENRVALHPGEGLCVEVVVANRKAGHSFPPELRDMYEPWVEFEALDASGNTLFHSGFVRPDRTLDESAHVYKSVLLDARSRPLTRHQVWLGTAKAYDNFIGAGRSDVVRFRFRVPAPKGPDGAVSLRLRARVNYRRFVKEYTDRVLERVGARLEMPVVEMAASEATLVGGGAAFKLTKPRSPSAAARAARRWNDYGIALLEQAQYGAAADAFRCACGLSPRDSDLLVNASIAELRTEQYGPGRAQLRKAATLLDGALKLNPGDARARLFRALVTRAEGRPREAAAELQKVAAEHPRDREVWRQLGQTLYLLGDLGAARAAFESVLRVDPNDAGAYQFLSPIYAGEGRGEDAARAGGLYLLWRDDPLADSVAARFFAANPQWDEERVGYHAHSDDSPPRPTPTGRLAAPLR